MVLAMVFTLTLRFFFEAVISPGAANIAENFRVNLFKHLCNIVILWK
jgi:hypothetical protein